MTHDLLLERYDRELPLLRERGERLRDELAGWLAAETDLKIHSVTLRLKTRASLAGKLARPDRSYAGLADVTDLVGLRVITFFEDTVDRVGQLVEGRLPVDFTQSVDKRSRRDAGAFGHRSLHYVCRLADSPVRCEIQVRTVLEHTWAEIEHNRGYKSRDALPAAGQQRLSRLARLLELADQEFVAIRQELERRGVALHADAIVAIVKPCFAFAWQTWRLSPEQMREIFRGYPLFFFAHAEVLRKRSLGLDNVERLARLYRAIECPDDERAAQLVARQHVEAFAETGM